MRRNARTSASSSSNLAFSVEAEDLMMSYVLDDGMSADAAAEKWLKANPDVLDALARRGDHARRPARARRRCVRGSASEPPCRAADGRRPNSRRKARDSAAIDGEAGALGDVGHREAGVEHEPPRRLEPQREIVGARRGADGAAEQRLERARRDAAAPRDGADRERLVEVRLHHPDRRRDARLAVAEPAERDERLRLARRAWSRRRRRRSRRRARSRSPAGRGSAPASGRAPASRRRR